MKKWKTKTYSFGIGTKELYKVCFCAFLVPTCIPQAYAGAVPIVPLTEFRDVQQQITGTVTDNTGIPLAGVNVLIDGTTTGTQTDFDGKYTLTAQTGDVLVFSYIGMKTQSLTVGQSSTVDVIMEEDAASLEEVVVIGYGSQKKSDLTGAVGSVSAAELQERPAASLTQSLSGKMPV